MDLSTLAADEERLKKLLGFALIVICKECELRPDESALYSRFLLGSLISPRLPQ